MAKPYQWNVGEVVYAKNCKLRILQQTHLIEGKKKLTRRKAYEYLCEKCNYIGIKREPDFLKTGCPVCSGVKIKWNINSIAIRRPDLVHLFKNMEDAYEYGEYSSQKVKMICPNCKKELEKIIMDVAIQGLFCPYCSNKSSYAERIMRSLLKMCHEDFVPQKKFDWSNGRIYDFYLPKRKWVIEMHGCQHYQGESNFDTIGGKNYEEEQANDALKKQMCEENNIIYIEIDCRESTFEYIYISIISNPYLKQLNLSKVDIIKLEKEASSSMIKEVVDLWNQYYTLSEIEEKLEYKSTTVHRWIKQAQKLGLINDYHNETKLGRKGVGGIRCINIVTLDCYWQVSDAAKKENITKTTMSKWCHERKHNYMLLADYVQENNIKDDKLFFKEHLAKYYFEEE
jgi:Zn finger protein HypA/HybF involved in hydrogenase expression/transposase-like protein